MSVLHETSTILAEIDLAHALKWPNIGLCWDEVLQDGHVIDCNYAQIRRKSSNLLVVGV